MDNWNKPDAYWAREKTANGRKINDALDKHEEHTEWRSAARLPEHKQEEWYMQRDESLNEKDLWRSHFDKTGELVTPREGWERHEAQERQEFETRDRARNTSVDGVYVKEQETGPSRIGSFGEEHWTEIGQSEKGFHFKNQYVSPNSDEIYGTWSEAFKTKELAEQVARADRLDTSSESAWNRTTAKTRAQVLEQWSNLYNASSAELGNAERLQAKIDYSTMNDRLKTTQEQRDAARQNLSPATQSDTSHEHHRQQEQSRTEGMSL